MPFQTFSVNSYVNCIFFRRHKQAYTASKASFVFLSSLTWNGNYFFLNNNHWCLLQLFLFTASLSTAENFSCKFLLAKMCFVFKKSLQLAVFHYLTFFSCYIELLGKKFHVASRDLATWFSLSSMRFRWLIHHFDFEYLYICVHILLCFTETVNLWWTKMIISTWKYASACWIFLKSLSGKFCSTSDFTAHVPLLFTLHKYFSKEVCFEHLGNKCPFFKEITFWNNSHSHVLIFMVFQKRDIQTPLCDLQD